MRWSRRGMLVAAGTAALAGCGSTGLAGSATPPPSAFVAAPAGDHAVELRYTGIGAQDPARFRVVLSGAGPADGAYALDAVTGDDRWTDDDRYRLDQSSLGLEEPLRLEGATLELQYDDGDWRTLLRARLSG
ncbi:MAG: hypothetical protein U5J98_02915 [Halobacteriales archaeon]|nr:hypothetical protein [Halobacteriales archaeon]